MKFLINLVFFTILCSCNDSNNELQEDIRHDMSTVAVVDIANNTHNNIQNDDVNISGVSKPELVRFAKTLIGIPYKYAATDPSIGFDCSGFITYVFNHFNLAVPRSSIDFTNVGKEVSLIKAEAGDLILFTGTVDSIKTVGHMGIVTENIDTLKFIHSTSGKAYSVTTSSLTDHYKKRFVKVISVFSNGVFIGNKRRY